MSEKQHQINSVMTRERRRIIVLGRVQGVGFRPAVYRYACRFGLAGSVWNDSRGVVIEVEGEEKAIREFLDALLQKPPPQARIDDVEEHRVPLENQTGFYIQQSKSGDEMAVGMPPDLAVCDDCLDELFDPYERRYLYPFLNCTNCGPRFSIIRELPYDREKTSMSNFTMCEDCAEEYRDPANRRFDAQPNACAKCGPSLTLRDKEGRVDADDGAEKTVDLLKAGKLVAIKGLGGFHLACNALDAEAIAKLRRRKCRPAKPLAVMFDNLDQIRQYCYVTVADEAELVSSARPIVVLKRRSNTGLPVSISPDTDDVGAFLPYTPLHHLLTVAVSPLVMTSANLRDEPIAMNTTEACELLDAVVDYVLDHDREIVRRCDDSLVKNWKNHRSILRRSRGFVPNPIILPCTVPPIIACGGDLKNAFCVTRGNQAFLSQYVGDLQELRALQFYERQIIDFQDLLQVKPEFIACDMHPDYKSTEYASKRQDGDSSVKVISVQHHHAHIAACLAENMVTSPVIGVAFDGTGYGEDGTIWGGEFLVADLKKARRAGHIRQFSLPGGEAAVREPIRTTVSLLYQAGFDVVGGDLPESLRLLSRYEREVLRQMLIRDVNVPVTSSAGRIFDGVAALLGLCREGEVSYEAQAAIRLESIADRDVANVYRHFITTGLEIDFSPMLEDIIIDLRCGVSISRIAGIFHNTVANAVIDMCCRIRETENLNYVALSGGVFQNAVLVDKVNSGLVQRGFKTFLHYQVPPNDGGIALGQAVVAAARWNKMRDGMHAAI
ncbi:MAG: carbamoyltransferase HypF [Verrucomicrobiota bacterium]